MNQVSLSDTSKKKVKQVIIIKSIAYKFIVCKMTKTKFMPHIQDVKYHKLNVLITDVHLMHLIHLIHT